MKKLLRPLDIFLLGLSGFATILEDFKDPFGITKAPYEDIYSWVHPRFRKKDYYQMVYHALRTGYVEKVIKKGEPYFRLTSKGQGKITRDFSLKGLQNKKWDGKWRVVIFDINEKKRKDRDSLRNKLRELGFGMIQESVWISPYDIIVDLREFVKTIGLGDQVFLMEVGGLLAGDQKRLANKIWSLENINKEYHDLYSVLIKLHDREKLSMAKVEKEKARKELAEARNTYLLILKDDPCLPKELLPEDWYGEEVKKLLRNL